MWLLAPLAGCTGPTGSASAVGTGPSSIRVEPIAIYFGDVPWDEPGSECLPALVCK